MWTALLLAAPTALGSLDEPGVSPSQSHYAVSFSSPQTLTGTDTRGVGNGVSNTAVDCDDQGGLNLNDCIGVRPASNAADTPGTWANPDTTIDYEVWFCSDSAVERTITLSFFINRTSGPTGTTGNKFTSTTIQVRDSINPGNQCDAGSVFTVGNFCRTTAPQDPECVNDGAIQSRDVEDGVFQVLAGSAYRLEVSGTDFDSPGVHLGAAITISQTNLGVRAKNSGLVNNTVITGSTDAQTAYLEANVEVGYCVSTNSLNCSIASGLALVGWDGDGGGPDTDKLFNVTFNLTLGTTLVATSIVQADSSGLAHANLSLPFPWTTTGYYKLSLQGSYGMDRSNAEALVFAVRPVLSRIETLSFDADGGVFAVIYPTPYRSDQTLYLAGEVINAANSDVSALSWEWGNNSVQVNTNMIKNLNITQPAQGVRYLMITTFTDSELVVFVNNKQASLNVSIVTSGPNGMTLNAGTTRFETGCNLGAAICIGGANPHNDNSTGDGNFTVFRVTTATLALDEVNRKLDNMAFDALARTTGIDAVSFVVIFAGTLVLWHFNLKSRRPFFLVTIGFLHAASAFIGVSLIETNKIVGVTLLGLHLAGFGYASFRAGLQVLEDKRSLMMARESGDEAD